MMVYITIALGSVPWKFYRKAVDMTGIRSAFECHMQVIEQDEIEGQEKNEMAFYPEIYPSADPTRKIS